MDTRQHKSRSVKVAEAIVMEEMQQSWLSARNGKRQDKGLQSPAIEHNLLVQIPHLLRKMCGIYEQLLTV